MDIQLTDGLSFEIFKKTIVRKPVIFITAYNEYARRLSRLTELDTC